jgi:hypothetical protein
MLVIAKGVLSTGVVYQAHQPVARRSQQLVDRTGSPSTVGHNAIRPVRHNLVKVSIANDEQVTVRDLVEGENIVVIAAQTDRPLRDTRATQAEMCLVTTYSAGRTDRLPAGGAVAEGGG